MAAQLNRAGIGRDFQMKAKRTGSTFEHLQLDNADGSIATQQRPASGLRSRYSGSKSSQTRYSNLHQRNKDITPIQQILEKNEQYLNKTAGSSKKLMSPMAPSAPNALSSKNVAKDKNSRGAQARSFYA